MVQSLRTTLILVTLVVALAGATVWGFLALTKPFPKSEPPPLCVPTNWSAGDTIGASDVVVSVFNASTRPGLAGQGLATLTERGFVAGDTGNAPAEVPADRVVIIGKADNPGVVLVAKQYRKPVIKEGPELGRGVAVVLGENFKKAGKPVTSLVVKDPGVVCSPPSSL